MPVCICRPTGPHLPSHRPTSAAPPAHICRPTGPQMKACRPASDRQDEKKDLEAVYSLTTTLKHIFGWIPIKEFSQTIDIYCCQVNSKRPNLSCPKPNKIAGRHRPVPESRPSAQLPKGDKVFQLVLVSIQGVKSIVIPHSNRLACKNILLSSFEPC